MAAPPVEPTGGRTSAATAALIGGLSVAVVAAVIAIVALVVSRGGEPDVTSSRSTRSGASSTDERGSAASTTSLATTTSATTTVVVVPPPPPTVPAVLARAEGFLSQSAQGRSAVQSGVSACRNGSVSEALSGLQEGKANRRLILDGLSDVNIAGFESLFRDMQTAMLLSIEADDLYQEWVRYTECFYELDSSVYLSQADAKSGEATAAKERFVAAWNPVAQQYGLRQFNAGQI